MLVDDWLTLRAPGDCLQACLCLRMRLAACLAHKVRSLLASGSACLCRLMHAHAPSRLLRTPCSNM